MTPIISDPPSDEHILRYLAGELDSASAEQVRRYLEATPERRGVVAGLNKVLQHDRLAGGTPDTSHSLAQVFARLDAEEQTPHSAELPSKATHMRWARGPRNASPSRLPHTARGLTAGGVGALLTALALVLMRPNTVQRDRLASRTYRTGIGERATITLSHDTRVTLAPRSTLTVDHETVSLVGEAFFTVTHHADRPLVVRTGAVTTRVLGTAFDVMHYAGTRGTRVVVLDGKVATGTTRPVTLGARMMALVTDSSVTTAIAENTDALTSWRTGRLVFHDTAVPEVLAAVERWYGITFRVTDPAIAAQHLTTTIDPQHTRAGTLAALATTLGVDMAALGDTIVLTPRRTPWRGPTSSPMRGLNTRDMTPEVLTPSTEMGR